MKVLIVPMAALAETAGSFSRCALMAEVFHKAGIEVATCIARDLNYREIKGIKNYYLDIPMPFGMHGFIATKTFPLAQRLGITARKTVSSFDQVLQFTGNLDYRYLKKSVQSISRAIVRNHAGVMIDNGDFQAVRLRQEMEKVVRAEEIKENIKNLAGKLQQQGGL